MSKLATRTPKVRHPIRTTGARALTATGGVGYERDAKSDLFLLAATNLVSEQTHHEDAAVRDARFVALIHAVVAEDPEWVAALVPYLRDTLNMRSGSIVMAAEYVAAGGPNGRSVVRAALRRADEPGEMLGYWLSTYGRPIPRPVKRGIADAIETLYTERSALRYDGAKRPFRFGNVIEIVGWSAFGETRRALWTYLVDSAHNRPNPRLPHAILPTITADRALMVAPPGQRRGLARSETMRVAGWSWERLAGWLPGGMDADAWETVIPRMGYMALLRNLRNFDEAGVSDDAAQIVAVKLSDPAEVLSSRQFPIRFYSAYAEAGSLRWAYPLERALDASLGNVPRLKGRTLILLDLSPSMKDSLSARSKRSRAEAASVFVSALARRADNATTVVYSHPNSDISHEARTMPTLRFVESCKAWMAADTEGGTFTFTALRDHYRDHDRVVILTDGQAHDAPGMPQFWPRGMVGVPVTVPEIRPIYTFNLAGYRVAHLASGEAGRYEIGGGFTDAAFRLIPVLEARHDGRWPHLDTPPPAPRGQSIDEDEEIAP